MSKKKPSPPETETSLSQLGLVVAVLDQSPLAVFCCDDQGAVVFVNRRAEELTGTSAAELVGKRLPLVEPAGELATWNQWTKGAGQLFSYRTQLTKTDQTTLPVEVAVRTLELAGRKLTAFFAAVFSENVKPDELGETISSQYFEVAAAAMVSLDPQGRVLQINPAACNLLKVKAADALGQDWFKRFLPARDQRRMRKTFELMLSSVNTPKFGGRNLVVDAAGVEHELLWSMAVVRNASGQPLMVVSSGTEVVEEQQLIAELRTKEQLLDQVGDAVLLVDMDGAVKWANQTAESVYGWRRSELTRLKASELVQPEDQQRSFAEMRRIISEGRGTFSLRHRRKDGQTFLTSINASVVDLPPGRQLLLTVRDVTSLQQREMRLRQVDRALQIMSEMNLAVRQANSEKGLLEMACRLMTRLGGYRLSWIVAVGQSGQLSSEAAFGFDEGFTQAALDQANGIDANSSPFQQAIASGQTLFADDIAAAKTWGDLRSAAEIRGLKSALLLPLIVHGQVVGLLVVFGGVEQTHESGEQSLVEKLSESLSYGIFSLRLRGEAGLRSREAEMRAQLLDAATDAFIVRELPSMKFVYANAAMAQLTGRKLEEVAKSDMMTALPPEMRAPWIDIFGRAARGENTQVEAQLLNGDGQKIDVEVKAYLVQGDGRQLLVAAIRDISERRASARRLEESEARFRGFIEGTNDTYYELAPDGTLIFISGQARKYGYEPKELIGKKFVDFIHPDDRPLIVQKFLDGLAGKEVDATEARFLRPDGSSFWQEAMTFYKHDADGKPLVSIGVLRDIDERKRAEQALAETERRYADIFENSRDGYVFMQLDGKIIDANNAYCEMLGYDLKALKALPDSFVLTPEKWLAWEKKEIWQERLLKKGFSGIYEKEYVRQGGAVLPVEVSAYAVREVKGEIRYIWAVVRDISERQAASAALRESERKFRGLIESSSDALFEVDGVGTLTYVSPQFATWGLDVTRMVGRSLRDYVHTEDVRPVWHEVQSVLHGAAAEMVAFRLAGRGVKGDIWVELKGSPLRDESDAISGYFGSLRDVTERRQSAAELAESERRFRAFAEGSNDVIIFMRRSGLIEYISPQITRYGIKPEEIVGRSIFRFLAPELRAKTIRGFIDALRRKPGEEIVLNSAMVNSAGERHWFEALGRQQLDKHGHSTIIAVLRNVDARKADEERRQVTERRFAEMTDGLRIGVYRNTPGTTGKFISVNQAMIDIFEAGSAKEMLATSVSSLYVDAQQRAVFSDKLKRQGSVHNEELRLKTLKGREIWVSLTAVAKTDPDGQTYFDGLMMDITDRKLAEERAGSSQRRLAEILDNLTVGVYRRTVVSPTKFVEVNAALVRMFEADSEEQMRQTTIGDLYVDVADFKRFNDLLLRRQRVQGDLLRLKTLKGRIFWAAVSGVVRRTTDGQSFFDGIVEDVTDRQLTIERLRQRSEQERLIASISRDFINVPAKRFPAALTAAIDSVAKAIGADIGHLVKIDPDRKLEGRDHAATLVGSVGDTPAAHSEALWTWWLTKIALGQTVHIDDVAALPEEAAAERTDLMASGVHSAVAVPLMVRGRPLGFICFEMSQTQRSWTEEDITVLNLFAEIVANAYDRMQALERAAEADKLRSKFVQVVSHQLRTPLTSIRWNLESLLSEEMGKLDPAQKEVLRVAYNHQVETIDRLGEMLTALDIEEGRVSLNREEVAIESLWGSVMADIVKNADLKGVKLIYQPSVEQLPSVELDADKIRQVLHALSENALQYTPAGGEIAVSLSRSERNIRFEVHDSGIGIPKTEQSFIFRRFYRATNAPQMKQDASGLGLAIAKFNVEQHGGQIGFQSEEGKGTTFWFELPIR